MLTNQLNNAKTFHVRRQTRIEVNRLLAAAVVSRTFCDLLLKDPSAAIEQGFAGEYFNLSADEHRVIRSIHCNTLAEFAQQLEKVLFVPALSSPRVQNSENYAVSSWPI